MNQVDSQSLQLVIGENSSIKIANSVTQKKKISSIDEWTTAFTSNTQIVLEKLPARASELLSYLELVRYAAKYHQSLGWLVYDNKFRSKAANDKSINWGRVDQPLWLRTFTVNQSVLLQEHASLFSNGPYNNDSEAVAKGTEFATTSTVTDPVCLPPAATATCVTNQAVLAATPALSAPKTLYDAVEQEGQSHPVVVSSFNDSVVTPIDVERLEYELRSHPKPTFVGKLCKELREGAHIGYEGPRLAREAKNLPTANSNPTKVTQNIEKEVSMGRTAGPFREPPFKNFQVSPLGLVPKKNSEKFRTIFHLSYPKAGDSINSAIEGEKYPLSYVTIDDAIRAIQELGPRTHMAKTDIESAFRLFPVHPDDWELLGMKWQGLYYFDKVLPFGLRSAPFLFNQLSEGVEWILYADFDVLRHFSLTSY